MATTDSIESKPSASATNPSTHVQESSPIGIQGRIGLALFLIVGSMLAMKILIDLLFAIFR